MANNQNKKAEKYAKQEKLLASHRCLKSFEKSLKAMDSDRGKNKKQDTTQKDG